LPINLPSIPSLVRRGSSAYVPLSLIRRGVRGEVSKPVKQNFPISKRIKYFSLLVRLVFFEIKSVINILKAGNEENVLRGRSRFG
jgi:hypothetical protein